MTIYIMAAVIILLLLLILLGLATERILFIPLDEGEIPSWGIGFDESYDWFFLYMDIGKRFIIVRLWRAS